MAEWLRSNRSQYPSRENLIQAAMKHFHKPRKAIVDALGKIKTPVLQNKAVAGLSIKDLKDKYDETHKLRQACKKLQKGRFLREREIRELSCVPTNKWREVADDMEFDNYKFCPRRGEIYWGHPESIEDIRKEIPHVA